MRTAGGAILLLISLSASLSTARADGKVAGKVTGTDGAPLAGITVNLVPADKGAVHLAAKTNKKGEYFFGIVRNGQYSVTVEGTDLVPYTIKVSEFDTENKKSLLDYQGEPTTPPQIVDVDIDHKITYDLVLGEKSKSPAALAEKAADQKADEGEIPGLLQSGDFKGAIAKIDEALKEHPDDPVLHYWRGFALFRLNDLEAAKTSISRALELNPGQLGAHYVMGGVLNAMGKKQQAVSEFEAELNNPNDDPTKVNIYINIGLDQRELGNKPAAIVAFEKVVEIDPKQLDAYSYLSELYLGSGQADKADDAMRRSQEAGGVDAAAIFNIGANYWNSKEYEKAGRYFRKAVAADPKLAPAWKSLGYAEMRNGRTAEAVAALKKYLELAPDAADANEIRQTIAALSGK